MTRLRPDGSWWLKRDRAERHLEELKDAIAPYVAVREHVVTERHQPKNQPDQRWVYNAFVDGSPDQGWAYIAGDVLFNLRCSLDHMAVALNPRKNKSKVYFPIIHEDPWEREPGTRRYVQRDPATRRNFHRWTRDMEPVAATYVKAVQPYHHPGRIDEHVAYTLSRFHNADKHRQELVQITGIRVDRVEFTHANGAVTTIDGSADPVAINDGAILDLLPEKMNLKVFGSALIGIGNNVNGCYEVPGILDGMFRWVDDVLGQLETRL